MLKERIAVTLDPDLVAYVRERAEAERLTLSAALNRLIAEAMDQERPKGAGRR